MCAKVLYQTAKFIQNIAKIDLKSPIGFLKDRNKLKNFFWYIRPIFPYGGGQPMKSDKLSSRSPLYWVSRKGTQTKVYHWPPQIVNIGCLDCKYDIVLTQGFKNPIGLLKWKYCIYWGGALLKDYWKFIVSVCGCLPPFPPHKCSNWWLFLFSLLKTSLLNYF